MEVRKAYSNKTPSINRLQRRLTDDFLMASIHSSLSSAESTDKKCGPVVVEISAGEGEGGGRKERREEEQELKCLVFRMRYLHYTAQLVV